MTSDASPTVSSWRYGLLPVLALLLPGLWLASDGDVVPGIAAAVSGVTISSFGAIAAWRIRGQPIHAVLHKGALAWSATVIGVLVPTIVFTGWLPSRRPRLRPDLDLQTVAGRVAVSIAAGAAVILVMTLATSPKRGGGHLQRYLARRWRRGLCDSCGMARFRAERTCSYCGADKPEHPPIEGSTDHRSQPS